MNRSLTMLRAATVGDAPVLCELWGEGLRRADATEQVVDLEHIIKTAATSAEQRLVVAEYDGEVAGAVLLRVSTVSPLNLEPVLQAFSPYVFPRFRRHGVGRLLMEAAVTWAEELGVPHLATAAHSSSRDSNRFMARLALGPIATVRIAPVAAVRAKLTTQRPALPSTAGTAPRVSRVVAARRSMRRARPAADRG